MASLTIDDPRRTKSRPLTLRLNRNELAVIRRAIAEMCIEMTNQQARGDRYALSVLKVAEKIYDEINLPKGVK